MDCSRLRNSKETFIVLPYSIGQFKECLLAFSDISREALDRKLDNDYYKDYFSTVNTKTIVVEKNYVNKDFLDDFSNYYVKCFKPYKRYCTRLHFFDTKFTIKILNNLIVQKNASSLNKFQNSYLGYIVVKHLPFSIIGKTCLKTYISSNDRHFPSLQKYDVHLCGIPLSITTLAFQEQDSVVAACATSALWSVFQGTGKLFQHSIPSPYEITKNATIDTPTDTRTFPNNGLTMEMMAKAIKTIGLEPLLVSPYNKEFTKAAIYAYLKAKIPLLMGHSLCNIATCKELGKHAVAITGYCIEKIPQISIPYKSSDTPINAGILLTSSRISKIYVHDDQVGPFARMCFKDFKFADKNGKETLFWAITTSWGMKNKKEMCFALPSALLVPTYHKIRIPFEKVFSQIYEFNHILQSYTKQNPLTNQIFNGIEWDIYLTTINDFKADIINNNKLTPKQKIKICKTCYPRFLWRATAQINCEPLFDFIFDATDIEQNEYIIEVINYRNPLILEILKSYATIYYKNLGLEYTDNIIIKYLSATNNFA